MGGWANDQHAAEAVILQLEAALREHFLIDVGERTVATMDVRRDVLAALAASLTYCRPSCGRHGEPHDHDAASEHGSACDCLCHLRGRRSFGRAEAT